MVPTLKSLSRQAQILVSAALATLLTVWVMSAWLSPRPDAGSPVQIRQSSAPTAGTILTGSFSAWGSANGYIGDDSQFSTKLAYAVKSGRYGYVQGGAYTTNCPGVGKVAPLGWLCFYEVGSSGASFGGVFNPNKNGDTTSKTGFTAFWTTSSSGYTFAYGQWSMKVGGAAQAPTRSDPTAKLPSVR